MDELPEELITHGICSFLINIDQQLLRRCSKQFARIIPYKAIEWLNDPIELVHLIKYKRLWTVSTTVWAAMNGHLDCLKYAHENGCPWDSQTTALAAEYGHLDCLEYARKNGCA